MSAFLSKLVLLDDGNGHTMDLVEPLQYQSDLLKRVITVPAGFRTDFASVPRGLWNVVPKTGKHDRAAIVHDFLYQYNGVPREVADGVFKEALAVCGVSTFYQWSMWSAVRIGGGKIWAAYRAADLQKKAA